MTEEPSRRSKVHVELGTPEGGNAKARAKVADIIRGNTGGKAFADAGWKPAASSSGAVNPGVLAALRRAWDEQR